MLYNRDVQSIAGLGVETMEKRALRVVKDKIIRKITKTGDYTYYITIPREFISELAWRKKQKVVVQKIDKKIVIEDWEKKEKKQSSIMLKYS